jgi:hypothetical protein
VINRLSPATRTTTTATSSLAAQLPQQSPQLLFAACQAKRATITAAISGPKITKGPEDLRDQIGQREVQT